MNFCAQFSNIKKGTFYKYDIWHQSIPELVQLSISVIVFHKYQLYNILSERIHHCLNNNIHIYYSLLFFTKINETNLVMSDSDVILVMNLPSNDETIVNTYNIEISNKNFIIILLLLVLHLRSR